MPVREVTARELARALQGPEAERPVIVDVRTAEEVRVACIRGSLHVPLHELPARLDELRGVARRPLVVLCHLGARSYHAAALLESVGIPAVSAGRHRGLGGGGGPAHAEVLTPCHARLPAAGASAVRATGSTGLEATLPGRTAVPTVPNDLREDLVTQAALEAYGAVRHEGWLADRAPTTSSG
jgi:rhodanese-related sulfurtransferase